ncbi:MAG: hypothetical protein WC052_05135 [Patescibacteria group bacterium]
MSNIVGLSKTIMITVREGSGVSGDPVRHVMYFYTEALEQLAVVDKFKESERAGVGIPNSGGSFPIIIRTDGDPRVVPCDPINATNKTLNNIAAHVAAAKDSKFGTKPCCGSNGPRHRASCQGYPVEIKEPEARCRECMTKFEYVGHYMDAVCPNCKSTDLEKV